MSDNQSVILTSTESQESSRLERQKKRAMERGDGEAVDRLEEQQEILRLRINERVNRNYNDEVRT